LFLLGLVELLSQDAGPQLHRQVSEAASINVLVHLPGLFHVPQV
jgi:hypothetical protein